MGLPDPCRIPGAMRNVLLALAVFMIACSESPGDQMVRVCGSNAQVDVMAAGRLLKENPEVVKYANSHGTTPLHSACRVWNFFVVTSLLDAGADPNARDKDGNTPTHLALGAIEGQNYGAADNLPGTPLTEQQKQARSQVQSQVSLNQSVNRQDIVRYLINHKADFTIKNNEGKTPLEFSDQSRPVYDHVVNMMEDRKNMR